MDFELNEEQQSLQRTLRDFVDREIAPVAREMEHSGEYPTEIVDGLKRMDLFGITVPEAYGGIGGDLVTLAIVFEEISRGWMGVAGTLGSHSLSCRMIATHGTDEQKQTYLPELATGQRRTGVALTEPHAGSDLQAIQTRAERRGDDYVINGAKAWITNARYADPLPVLVKTDPNATPARDGMSVILVPQDATGFRVTRDLPKLGYRGPETCELVFEDCVVPATNLLGEREGRGMQQVLSALEAGRINQAARAVGIAQAAYEQALRYAQERHTFGKPIVEHQAIQMKIADIATETEAARLLTYWAADRANRGRADVETGMAKLFASEVCIKASNEAMRVHGGYGYSQEFEVERLYRDSILMAIGEGTNEILRTVITRGLTARESR